MQAYTGFAQVYDIFMDNVPYDEWTGYLSGLLREYGVEDGLVLELGCGTGKITRRLAEQGYDMIGIDNSEEMLEIARDIEYENDFEDSNDIDENTDEDIDESRLENTDEDIVDNRLENTDEDIDENTDEDIDENTDEDIDENRLENTDEDTHENTVESLKEEPLDKRTILYLQQDMRNFELYGTVAAVVSICDSMNYITSDQDLLKVFKLVNNYLDAKGIFIFDMNTEYKYKHILSDNTIAENREDCSFIWENYYDENKMINEYEVTIYVKLEEEDMEKSQQIEKDEPIQLFERLQETHYQKAYSLKTVKRLLEEAGMEFVTVYDAFTHNAPTDKSERIYFVAREKHHDNKKYI